jgi:hypothetical protein
MSDEKATEFEAAFLEGADGEGQPGADATGRPAEGGGDGGQGDGGDQGATDPARAAAADQPATDPARAAEDDETTDEFAGLSADELRERLKATAAEVATEKSLRTKAENALRSNEGRFSRAEREAIELRRQLEAATPKEEARQEAPTVDDATLDRIATEYDDLGKPLVEAFRGLQARVEELNAAASKRTRPSAGSKASSSSSRTPSPRRTLTGTRS